MIVGKYTYVRGDNAEAILRAMNTPEDLIPMAVKLSIGDIEISLEGEVYTIDNGARQVHFKNGQAVEDKWTDIAFQMTFTITDERTMERRVTNSLGSQALERWSFSDEGIEVEQTASEGQVVAHRIYQRA